MAKRECKDHLGNIYSSVKDMCNFYGISSSTYLNRIKLGWNTETALTAPIKDYSCKDHLGNVFSSEQDMCDFYNIDYKLFYARTRDMKWNLGKALTAPVRDDSCEDFFGNSFTSVKEMCKYYGVEKSCYVHRILLGWSKEDALLTPSGEKPPHKEIIGPRCVKCTDHLGIEYTSMSRMCAAYNIQAGTFSRRIRNGWSLKEALTTPVHYTNACVDSEGIIYSSTEKMCKAHGVSRSWYNNRIELGFSIEEALDPNFKLYTRKNLNKNEVKKENNTKKKSYRCEDHLGNRFKSIKDMCNYYKIPYSAFIARTHRQNLSLEEALTKKVGYYVKDHVGNHFKSQKDMCDFYDIKEATYLRRISSGYSKEEALTIKTGGIKRKATGNQPHKAVTIDGVKYNSISDAANAFGLKQSTVSERLRKGWDIEDALKTSLNKHKQKQVTDYKGDKFDSFADLCSFYNKSCSLVYRRLYKGWTKEEALTIPRNMYIGEYRVAQCLKRLNVKFYHDCTIKTIFKDLNISVNWSDFLDKLQENMGKSGYIWSKQKISKLRPDFVIYTDEENKIIGVIEFDGEQHQNFVEYFFKTVEQFIMRNNADVVKTSLWECMSIPMLRIRHDQIDKIDYMVEDFIKYPRNYIYKHNTYLSEEEYWSVLKDQKEKFDLVFA